MPFNVRFKCQVTGTFSHLDVLILNQDVPSPGGKVDITESYAEHGNMKIQIQVSGLIGTDFSITYSCTSAGNATQDSAKISPLERTITSDGFKEVILNIPV